jgi:hypothetical protein
MDSCIRIALPILKAWEREVLLPLSIFAENTILRTLAACDNAGAKFICLVWRIAMVFACGQP